MSSGTKPPCLVVLTLTHCRLGVMIEDACGGVVAAGVVTVGVAKYSEG